MTPAARAARSVTLNPVSSRSRAQASTGPIALADAHGAIPAHINSTTGTELPALS